MQRTAVIPSRPCPKSTHSISSRAGRGGRLALAATLLITGLARSSSPPYAASPVIQSLDWHETVNLGTDNDNWPTTWADDDHVYTAGGDGAGFGGLRGNWICELTGTPPDVTGANVTRISIPSGPEGPKGSGLLSLGGVLYLWVRNVDGNGNCGQLCWSTDHGQSWTWGPVFPLLGYPTFINFGRDYAGARDSFVYSVSHDNPSAYAASTRFLLLRVPVSQIPNQAAYQYFVGMSGGTPLWSYDPSARGTVFTHENGGFGRCRRSGISYDAGLHRYLWWQGYPDENGATTQSFGVYDAPEPWGPWTTAYFTPAWDQDPGECGGFCTKYTSTDGNTLWLVFSGTDNLRMRRATVTRRSPTGVPLGAGAALSARAFPNPFTSSTRAEFSLSSARTVRVDVQDVRGRHVTTLLAASLGAGAHSVEWNGLDDQGRRAASGVYFITVDTGSARQTVRVVRLR